MKLLKFYADWCNPCKQQTSILEKCTIPIESVNIEDPDKQDLVDKYNIKSLPTIILLKDDLEVKRFIGLTSLDVIEKAYDTI